jgi:hypothetical protein
MTTSRGFSAASYAPRLQSTTRLGRHVRPLWILSWICAASFRFPAPEWCIFDPTFRFDWSLLLDKRVCFEPPKMLNPLLSITSSLCSPYLVSFSVLAELSCAAARTPFRARRHVLVLGHLSRLSWLQPGVKSRVLKLGRIGGESTDVVSLRHS